MRAARKISHETYMSKQSSILDPTQIQSILNHPQVIEHLGKLAPNTRSLTQPTQPTQSQVYFTLELSDSIKSALAEGLGLDLRGVKQVPLRWIVGDTATHADVGVKRFSNTHLVYLSDSEGEFLLNGVPHAIRAGQGFVFNEGVLHGTTGTGGVPRLLLGPMNEVGQAVGAPVVYYATESDALTYTDNIGVSAIIHSPRSLVFRVGA